MNPSQIPEPDALDPQLRSVIGNMGGARKLGEGHGFLETVGAGETAGTLAGIETGAEAGARGRTSGPFCPQPARLTMATPRANGLNRIRARKFIGKL